MTNRKRFYRNCGIGLVCVFGFSMVVYCWLAFGPTGYGRVERRYVEAIDRLEESRAPSPTAPSRFNQCLHAGCCWCWATWLRWSLGWEPAI